MAFESTYSADGSTAIGGPQSYYELPPAGGTNTRDNTPARTHSRRGRLLQPDSLTSPATGYENDIQIIGSANTAGGRRPTAISATWAKAASAVGPAAGFKSSRRITTVTLYNYTYTPPRRRTRPHRAGPAARAIAWCCN